MLSNLPILARNPFTLALLDPAVVNRYLHHEVERHGHGAVDLPFDCLEPWGTLMGYGQ